MSYRRKQEEVQAFQFDGQSCCFPEWLTPFLESKVVWFSLSDTLDPVMFVAHPKGVLPVNVGDYVVLRESGELIPSPAYEFVTKYEDIVEEPPVEEPPVEEPPVEEPPVEEPPVEEPPAEEPTQLEE